MRRVSCLWRRVALAILVTALPRALQSQGLAGAAVIGIVTRQSGEPVGQARVILRNTSTGFTREQQSRSTGRFVFEGIPPGGPYELGAFVLGLDWGARPVNDGERDSRLAGRARMGRIGESSGLMPIGLPARRQVQPDLSRWKIQLRMRYWPR